MRRLLLAVVVALSAAPHLARAELAFPVPAGWLDLSPGAPEQNFLRIPPAFREMLTQQKVRAFGADLAHTEAGFTPNFNAVLVEGNARITEAKVDEAADGMLRGLQRQIPGARLVEKGLVEVGGVKALRIVYDSEPGGRELRQMAVVVPGVPRSAVVTYTALRSQFAALRPAFEAHTATIRGAEEAGFLARLDWSSVLRSSLVGGAIGAVAGVLGLLVRRRKRAA
jgi:hypothetical protein